MALKLESDQSIEDVTETGCVLVDFYATWCGPCKQMEPVVEELHEDGDFEVLKVDVDENPVAAQTFGIRSVPTFMAFEDGEEVGQQVGSASKPELQKLFAADED